LQNADKLTALRELRVFGHAPTVLAPVLMCVEHFAGAENVMVLI